MTEMQKLKFNFANSNSEKTKIKFHQFVRKICFRRMKFYETSLE